MRNYVADTEIKMRLALFAGEFEVQLDCSPQDLEQSAVTSVALDKMVEKHDLGPIAYYYKDTGNPVHEMAIGSII